MKLLSTSLGKIIVACAAALIILGFVSTLLVPSIQDFSSKVFPSEKNYIIDNENHENLTLTCTESVVKLLIDDDADATIFANITATSTKSGNLITQLTEDYENPVNERTHVFVYQTKKDGTNVLSSSIDTSAPGKWAVLYVLNEGSERAVLKINYIVV